MGTVTDIRSRMSPVIEFDDSVPEHLHAGIKTQIAELLTRQHVPCVRVTNFRDGNVILAFTPATPARYIHITNTVQ